MEKLIKNNKAKEKPYQTILEVLTDYLHDKFTSRKATDLLANTTKNIES